MQSTQQLANSGIEINPYVNRMQMMALAANCRITAGRIGRRGGKTHIMIPGRLLKAAWAMKQSAGYLAGKSYRKILDHLLPEIVAGWQSFGLVEGIDFVVCKTPPPHFKRPYICPRNFDHGITFSWGSFIHLISFDYSSTSNGLATDYGAIDEAKQLDPLRVDSELMKTMSGHRSIRLDKNTLWGDLPLHTSTTIMTDGFIGKRDYKWIDRYAEHATHYNDIYEILLCVDELQKNYSYSLERYLWELQSKATLFMKAGTEENLAVLGIEYFENAYKNSSPLEFRASILNEDVAEIEGGFYSFLDESVHGYSESTNYGRIETLGIDSYRSGKGVNCLLDKDWKDNLPIKLSIDYGSDHSWCTVQQVYHQTYWLIKNFWVDTPRKFTDMIESFCDYYQPHIHKVIELYDDPYGHKEKTDTVVKDVQKVIEILKRRGWTVKHMTPANGYFRHSMKYRLMSYIMDERPTRDKRFPRFKINLNNAFQTFYSMSKAPLKRGKDEFGKDKKSESDITIPQWQATHLSDCADMPLCFDTFHLIDNKSSFIKGM